jgi:hypothetical protein
VTGIESRPPLERSHVSRYASKPTIAAVLVSALALGVGAGGVTFAASRAGSDRAIEACMSVKTGVLRLPTAAKRPGRSGRAG